MNKRRKNVSKDETEDNGFAAWGGYMAAKRAKLEEQFSEDVARECGEDHTDGSSIFRGVSIFVNGYTVPSADSLKRTMMLHGGVYHHYQTDKTTHVIASNLPNAKMKLLRSLKVVKPSWVVDSVEAGRLLDYRKYLLYAPRAQMKLNFGVEPEVGSRAVDTEQPRAPTRTATEPNFLSDFYSNSRLHHISTMGATFKQYVTSLRDASDGRFPGRDRLRQWKSDSNDVTADWRRSTVIMHIDMDCFFVSVGLRDKPHLRGRPVAVTHGKGKAHPQQREGVDRAFEANYYRKKLGVEERVVDVDETESMSEIASCNYKARRCGLKNGMFLGTALKLCPDLSTIPYNFEGYKEVSRCLYDTVASFTLDIEAVSCDEMFVDCTELLYSTSVTPLQFATFLRQEIKDKTGCTASAGFGANRLQARLATKKAKPDGQFHLQQSSVSHFMLDIAVQDLPGVGHNLAGRLRAMGVRSCSDLKSHAQGQLQKEFGIKTGTALYKHCRGDDDRPLNFGHQRKSVSAEVNYGIRFKTKDEADAFLRQLAGEVASRLKEVGKKGRCITLKLMVRAKEAPVETAKYLGHGVCDHMTRSCSLAVAVADQDTIAREVLSIARQLSIPPADMRGIGIQVSRLEDDVSAGSRGLDKFVVRKQSASDLSGPSTSKSERHDKASDEVTVQKPLASTSGPSVTRSRGPDMAAPSTSKSEDKCQDKASNAVTVQKASTSGPSLTKSRVISRPSTSRSKQHCHDRVSDAVPVQKPSASTSEAAPSTSRSETAAGESMLGVMPSDFSGLDKEVLAALPEDIREEVLRAYMSQSQAEPPDKDEICLYQTMSVAQVRVMVREWVSCEDVPQRCDVNMLVDYLERQVANHNIDDLDVVTRCLYRCVRKKSSDVWQCAYQHVMDKVQLMMVAVYGATLRPHSW